WNSLQCLHDWKRYLGYTAAGLGALTGITVFLAEVVIEKRITFLELPRKIEEPQKRSLIKKLKAGTGTHVQVHAYVTSDESQAYAAALIGVLTEAGWTAEGPVLYTARPPQEGIKVVVDNLANISVQARLLFDSLQQVGINDVEFELDPTPVPPSEWIIVRVGLK